MSQRFQNSADRVVVTGIGIITSVGSDRESVWRAVRRGQSGVRWIRGVPGVPDGMVPAAMVAWEDSTPGRLKNVPLSLLAAKEALRDSEVDFRHTDRTRFGCYVSGHMGNSNFVPEQQQRWDLLPKGRLTWLYQWFPHVACTAIAQEFGLQGPMCSHSTACASGTVDLLAAYRSLQRGRCELAITGSSEAIHPLFAAGFQNMRVLAHHEDPTQASRPFDRARNGFVMGEGAAMFVLERLDCALERGAKIYAEVLGGHMMADAHDLTALDIDSDALARLLEITLKRSGLAPEDVDLVSAHGTGTLQNDVLETRGIRRVFGPAADSLCVTALKSMLGHLVNASGSVEIALTALALRDGYVPPTINLTDPDPECDLDCVPLVGRKLAGEHALKLSVAFGGHLGAVALRRWSGSQAREPAGLQHSGNGAA